MRTRAYRPEVPCCLESRSLLSGAAAGAGDPFVLTHRQFHFIAAHMKQGFVLFGRYRDLIQLQNEIDDVVVMVPFGRVDGLRVSIIRVLHGMQRDLSAHVPHAVLSAQNEVIGLTRAEVEARVRAGDVVVR